MILPANEPKPLFFSIDVESDDPDWKGSAEGQKHENLQGLPALGEALHELGIKPTFLVTGGLAASGAFAAALEKSRFPQGYEIGTHFHAGEMPPFGPWDREAGDNRVRLPDAVLEEKFDHCHDQLTRAFGAPTVHRSGTWVLDGRMATLLAAKGYRVDSSVTPGVSWKLRGRPSYLRAPMRVYQMDLEDPCRPGDSGVVQVPVSIHNPREKAAERDARTLASLQTMPMASAPSFVRGFLKVVRGRTPVWLRPAFTALPAMQKAADALDASGYLHVMVHSNELWPGCSPYVRDEVALRGLTGRLTGILRHALKRGYRPAVLTEGLALAGMAA